MEMKSDGVRFCDECDSNIIDWYSCDDVHHLCVKHRISSDTFKCGRGVEEK